MPTSFPRELKRRIQQELQCSVEEDLAALRASQRASQDGATHEESRSEHAKDTRALESTYLARGLAERVVQLESELALLRSLLAQEATMEETGANREGAAGDEGPKARDRSIGLASLVSVEDPTSGEVAHYFMAPVGGGLVIESDGFRVRTITPASPIGQALLGRLVDDEITWASPQGERELVILAIE